MPKKTFLKPEQVDELMDLNCSGAGECHPEPVDSEDLDVTPDMSNHMLIKAKLDKANAKPLNCKIRKK